VFGLRGGGGGGDPAQPPAPRRPPPPPPDTAHATSALGCRHSWGPAPNELQGNGCDWQSHHQKPKPCTSCTCALLAQTVNSACTSTNTSNSTSKLGTHPKVPPCAAAVCPACTAAPPPSKGMRAFHHHIATTQKTHPKAPMYAVAACPACTHAPLPPPTHTQSTRDSNNPENSPQGAPVRCR
jgi:hypothetical protein